MKFRGPAALFIFLTFSGANAETVLLTKSFRPAPATLSGTLAPLALALNGEPIATEAKAIERLRLNDRDVPLQDETARSFYFRTDEDEIRLTGVGADGGTLAIFSGRLPKIRTIEIEGDRAVFTLEGELKKFTLDGKPYSVENPIPTEPGWIDRPHVVEISGEKGASRIYNLNFTEWRSQELESWGVGLAPISPSGPHDGGGYGVYLWRSWENRSVLGGSFNFASASTTETFPTYRQDLNTKSYSVLVRYGKYPFLPGQSLFDLKRLIVGPFLGRVWSRETHTNLPPSGTASVSETADGFWIGGFFIHETLLRYRGFGASLHFDFGFLSNRPGNVRAGPELSYTW